ncbi:hypothetical protein [Virgibacillus sp. DJP39]|uniref:hypothetical protein n=1 Tax=Virgibacillus sp. DJP39 TaxID=3409790 RepID=UPI003BB596A2
MVIQENMTPKEIVDTWEQTAEVFNQFSIPLVHDSLGSFMEEGILEKLLQELNQVVGSSSVTCVEGG